MQLSFTYYYVHTYNYILYFVIYIYRTVDVNLVGWKRACLFIMLATAFTVSGHA